MSTESSRNKAVIKAKVRLVVNSKMVRWILGVHFIISLYRRLLITCVFAGVKNLTIKGVQRLSKVLRHGFPLVTNVARVPVCRASRSWLPPRAQAGQRSAGIVLEVP